MFWHIVHIFYYKIMIFSIKFAFEFWDDVYKFFARINENSVQTMEKSIAIMYLPPYSALTCK